MVISTRKVVGRRKLRFSDLDAMLADAEHLARAGTKQLGNWSLGQNLQHLAMMQAASIDGFGRLMPWPVRKLLSLSVKRWFLTRGFPPSGPSPKQFVSEPIETAEALANFREAKRRVKYETRREPHPLFGNLTTEEWTMLYLRHAELHLSFCVPLDWPVA